MLILEPKIGEPIILYDTESDLQIVVNLFRRPTHNNLQLGFDAPERIKITRTRRNVADGNERTD